LKVRIFKDKKRWRIVKDGYWVIFYLSDTTKKTRRWERDISVKIGHQRKMRGLEKKRKENKKILE